MKASTRAVRRGKRRVLDVIFGSHQFQKAGADTARRWNMWREERLLRQRR